MRLKEKDIIRFIFIIFIIIGFIVLIWNFNKTIIEGLTSMSNDCNECRISPNYSPTATTSSYGLQNANSVIDANASTNPQYSLSGEQLLENYFGSALQGNNCINLDFSGVDGSYIFCPWQAGNVPSNLSECSNNTVFGSTTGTSIYSTSIYDTSYCCSNTSFYNNNYLLLNDVSRIYGLVFEVEDICNIQFTNIFGQEFSSNLYQFNHPSSLSQYKTYTINGFDTSINIKQPYIINPITQSFSGTDNQTAKTDKYINCSGDVCNNIIAQYTTNCLKIPSQYVLDNQWCYNESNYNNCVLTNIGEPSCNKLLLPKSGYGPNFSASGDTISPDGGFDITGSIQAGLQTAVDQLVSKFTQQINSLTSQIGDSLQFPNLGEVQYLDVGSCNNNSPYVYNSGCDTSLGYLGQYTCYPSLTGAFSDCGPPGYDPKPQF